ncbi:cysteine and tyrosine-rich protein 1-like [Saccostrea echinata]|uniref:cysteine and tyrosine-rich protein 1-like n=1 Tax=Saccostrea echinata TaxID=191078 RepID=UPI002A805985|nr:cysteine and tyrosine-rich protein 1-like [Saccostrea echinata]
MSSLRLLPLPSSKKTDMAEIPEVLCFLILFLFCDFVNGFFGESCGTGSCLYGYHCCSHSTGYCCPDGFICSGAICISLTVIIAPVVFGVIFIIVIIIVIIACKKKRARGVVIAPNTNPAIIQQQTTAYQYGQPQPANYTYGQPGLVGYSSYPTAQGPPGYPGQPQTSSDPAYPPQPAVYNQ